MPRRVYPAAGAAAGETSEGERMCSAEGCGRRIYCKGLCNVHYERARKAAPQVRCTFEGCERQVVGRGLCGGHYKQWHLGKPLAALESRLPRSMTPQERYWAKVNKDGPVPDPSIYGDIGNCWDWCAKLGPHGYGQFADEMAHRLSWEWANGPIEGGLHVLHSCDRRCCVRPSHLHLGTRSDNMQEMWARGRGPAKETYRRGEGIPWARLTEELVREIRRRAEAGEHGADLAREYGISRSSAQKVIRRRSWAHVA
jgi:hypothetical protein